VVQVVSFAQIMIASRFLDLSQFGVYALAWAAAVICNTLLFTGYYHALLRSRAFEVDRDAVFWLIAALGAVGALILGLIGTLAGGAATATGATFLMLAGFPLLRAPTAWNEAILVRAGRVRSVSLYVVLGECLAICVVYLGLRAGLGITALVIGRYVAALSDLVLTSALVRQRPAFRVDRTAISRGWPTARALWITNGLGMFTNYGADLILGAFLNPAAVGAYRGGSRISQTAADLILQPMELLSWARFSRLEQEGRHDAVQQVWLQTMALGAATLWPVLLCFAMMSNEIVTLVFADLWAPVAPILGLMCLSRALYFLSVLLEPTMVCRNRARDQLRTRAAGAVVLLVCLLGFGRLSGEAAAVAHVCASLAVATIGMGLMCSELRLSARKVAMALGPAVALSLLCGGLVLATAGLRTAFPGSAGFALTVLCVVLVWGATLAIGVRRRIFVLPTS